MGDIFVILFNFADYHLFSAKWVDLTKRGQIKVIGIEGQGFVKLFELIKEGLIKLNARRILAKLPPSTPINYR